jgi:hypothetical protein
MGSAGRLDDYRLIAQYSAWSLAGDLCHRAGLGSIAGFCYHEAILQLERMHDVRDERQRDGGVPPWRT